MELSGSLENIRIHGSVVGGLEKYLASLGYDVQALALEHGLTLGPPEEWSTRYISLVEYSQFLERVSGQLNDPYFSLSWTRADPAGGMKQMVLTVPFSITTSQMLKSIAIRVNRDINFSASSGDGAKRAANTICFMPPAGSARVQLSEKYGSLS